MKKNYVFFLSIFILCAFSNILPPTNSLVIGVDINNSPVKSQVINPNFGIFNRFLAPKKEIIELPFSAYFCQIKLGKGTNPYKGID